MTMVTVKFSCVGCGAVVLVEVQFLWSRYGCVVSDVFFELLLRWLKYSCVAVEVYLCWLFTNSCAHEICVDVSRL